MKKIPLFNFARSLATIFVEGSLFGSDEWEKHRKPKELMTESDYSIEILMMDVFVAELYVAGVVSINRFVGGNIEIGQRLMTVFEEEVIKILKDKGHFQDGLEAKFFDMSEEKMFPEYNALAKTFKINGHIPLTKIDAFCDAIAERIVLGRNQDKSFQIGAARGLAKTVVSMDSYIEDWKNLGFELELDPNVKNMADKTDLSSEEKQHLKNLVTQMALTEMAQAQDLIMNCNIAFQFAKTHSSYLKDWEKTKTQMEYNFKTGNLPPGVSVNLYVAIIDASDKVIQRKLKAVRDAFREKFGESIYNYLGPDGKTKKLFGIFG